MKNLKTFDAVNEDKRTPITINEISEAFTEFFDKMNEYMSVMDDDTLDLLRPAMKQLNKALENEADAHGVDFTEIKIKF